MFIMAKRNIKLYFRDKANVFFSLMAVLVIVALNIFFLTDTLNKGMSEVPHIERLVGTWLVAGIVAVTSTTTALGSLHIMIDDKARKIHKDFYTSPLRRSSLAGGYLISCMVVGVIMSVIACAAGIGYMVYLGSDIPSAATLAKTLGVIVLAVLANGSLMFFITTLLSSASAFSAFSTVVGTLIGFLMGIYMPIGNLPDGIQWVVKLFPPTYTASALRAVLMEDVLSETFGGMAAPPQNLPEGYEIMTRADFEQFMGVNFAFGNYTTDLTTALAVMTAAAVLFCGLSVIAVGRKNR